MKIKSVVLRSFKRFHELQVLDLPATARLIFMLGPNGCGKSSVFDAFASWHFLRLGWASWEPGYYPKIGETDKGFRESVNVEFHGSEPTAAEQIKKTFYIRSAYRHEPEFSVRTLAQSQPILDDSRRPKRMIDSDIRVSDNYQRLVAETIAGVYDGIHDSNSVRELREKLTGRLRTSLQNVFEDLALDNLGRPLDNGSFFFIKGVSRDFHYKNLSGGEKAVFDLLLDLIVKGIYFDDTVFCIDEPELHMHTRVQGRLLSELLSLIPANCQLWLASHSIGMMRKAKELHQRAPDEVVFLDFHDRDFDGTVVLRPEPLHRELWSKALAVAIDDLAGLVAPAQVVLCEGKPRSGPDGGKAEFDAACYRRIFAQEYPDTDFFSIGNASDVQSDRLQVGRTIQSIASGTRIIRLIDRDDRSSPEIAELLTDGVRVLSRRQLESYLLDDEILAALCRSAEKPEKIGEVLAAKATAIDESVARGNDRQDMKSVKGKIYTEVKRILSLSGHGSTADAFCRDTLAPLVSSATETYQELKRDIFCDSSSPGSEAPGHA